MRRLYVSAGVAILVTAIIGTNWTLTANSAPSSEPDNRCVSKSEFDKVQADTTRAQVHDIFGLNGMFVNKQTSGYEARAQTGQQSSFLREELILSYPGCSGAGVLVGFVRKTIDEDRGPYKLREKRRISL